MANHNFLSPTFLKQYEGVTPRNKGILFEVVYSRTYSRWLPEKKRRETWAETVERVVNYNVGLYQGPASPEDLIAEAELMYDKVFHLEVLPAGRTLWVGGTEASQKWPDANFNCAFLSIRKLSDLSDILALLLVGSGVGYKILEEDVASIPRLNPSFKIDHSPYTPLAKSERKEHTTFTTFPENVIEVGDSKEGWVKALRLFFSLLEQGQEKITIVYDSVRPAGERIKTFGGRAAGHEGLMDMFQNIERIIKECNGVLSSVACMDIANLIAKNVIVGGTRRSAQIALGSPRDQEFITAKKNLFKQVDGKWIVDETKVHRTMSNNSVTYTSKPSYSEVENIFENIKHNGEPGFFNLESAKRKRPKANGINPCAEILMDNYGVCNLSTVVISSHIRHGELDLQRLEDSFRLATRIGMRQTNVTLTMPHWDEVQKRDRLTGVSMTGIMDAFDRVGLEAPERVLEGFRRAANDEADRYAFEMRIPRPLLVTAIKPEGTLSLLTTVSAGLHRSYAPYFIRRISVSDMDPVCKALQELGVPNEPKIGGAGRVIFSFPIASGAKMAAADEPALSQFNRYLMMQKHYTDHNSSCTLTVGPEEWEDITKAVYDNWDDVVACAFLPKDTSAYPQLPYSAISREEYEELIKDFPDLTNLSEVVNLYEQEEAEEDELDSDCGLKGACPVR